GIHAHECGPFVQDFAIDEDIRRLDLDDIILQPDQPFDVEIAAGWRRDLRNVGCVEDDDLTATRFAEVVADLIHKNVIAAPPKPVALIHLPLENNPREALENGWRTAAIFKRPVIGWQIYPVQGRLHRAGRNLEGLDEKRP